MVSDNTIFLPSDMNLQSPENLFWVGTKYIHNMRIWW